MTDQISRKIFDRRRKRCGVLLIPNELSFLDEEAVTEEIAKAFQMPVLHGPRELLNDIRVLP